MAHLQLNPREAAYQALLASIKEESFISDFLERWRHAANPTPQDAALAYEISYGTARMALALDHAAKQLAHKEKLSLKQRERLLLRMALYQHLYLDKIPLYAIVNETMQIAKKHCHPTFAKFLHVLLRRLETTTFTPSENLATRYS